MTPSMLLKSCATPPARRPSDSIFCACRSSASRRRRSEGSRRMYTTIGSPPSPRPRPRRALEGELGAGGAHEVAVLRSLHAVGDQPAAADGHVVVLFLDHEVVVVAADELGAPTAEEAPRLAVAFAEPITHVEDEDGVVRLL